MSKVANVTIIEGADKMFKTGKVVNTFKLLEQSAVLLHEGKPSVNLQDTETLIVRRGQYGAINISMLTGEGDGELGIKITADGRGLEDCHADRTGNIIMRWAYSKIKEEGPSLSGGVDDRHELEEQRRDPAAVAARAAQSGGPDNLAEAAFMEKIIDIEAHHNSDIKTSFNRHGVKAILTWAHRQDLDGASAMAHEGKLVDDTIEVLARNIREFPESPRDLRVALKADPAGLGIDVVVFGRTTDLYRVDIVNNDLNLVHRNFAVSKDMPMVIISDVTINGTAPVTMARLPVNEVTSFNQTTADVKFDALILNADLEHVIAYFGPEQLDKLVGYVVTEVFKDPTVTMKWVDSINVRLVDNADGYFLVVEVVQQGSTPSYVGELYSVNEKGILIEDHNVAFALHPGWTIQLTGFRATPASVLMGRSHRPRLHADRDFGRGRELGDYERLGPLSGGQEEEEQRREDPVRIPNREWIPQINQFVHIEGEPTLYFIADYDQLEHRFLLKQADSSRRERDSRLDSRYRDNRKNADGLIPVEPGRLRPFTLFH